MKLKKILLPLALSLLTLFGCSSDATPSTKPSPTESTSSQTSSEDLQVVTSSFVTYDIARYLMADLGETSLLLKPGSEAHSFDPTPRDILRLSEADVFIYTNEVMEPWVTDLLKSVDNPDLLVINASEGIPLAESDAHEAEQEGDHDHDHEEAHEEEAHGDHHDHSVDPHTWTSMTNAQTMVNTISQKITERHPSTETLLAPGKDAYNRELQSLDDAYREVFAQAKRKKIFFIGHFALGYLLRDYDFEYEALFESFDHESEPTPQVLQAFIDHIRGEDTKVVYKEELSNLKIVDSIQEETGISVLELSASHNISQEQLDEGLTFFQIQRQNIENLKEGLY